ncbi:MAG: phosphotransferase family protein [Sphingomonadales bacterium]|nr:phosphotransferase family protein [Sphingomonadales bacterium]MDE2567856.1 phosphotransferase family protein [Sphingomonadales bacterium]
MARGGIAGAVTGLHRLTGGANMQSWRFTCHGEDFVLRRAPSADWLAARPLYLANEAEVIRRAATGGVLAPEVVAELKDTDGIGIGFVMRAIAGTADPGTVLAGDPRAMIEDLATALARIHALDTQGLGFLPVLDAAPGVESLAERFAAHGGDRPVIALGLAWLRAHLPAQAPRRLVHGDLRIGNVMADGGRLTGVLDWELAHLGDSHEDLAYGCMTVWRFGRLDAPAFGFTDLDTYFAAYEAAGGAQVDRARFRFWLVFRTVWWWLGCADMGQYWRGGTDRSIERVVVSRRGAEQELDLLLLLEDDAPEAERARALAPAPARPGERKGEASAGEILTAVSEWLAATVKPKLEGRDRFDLAVAQNALGIVRRELAGRPDPHDRALADEILAGQADLATPGLLARLRRTVLDTLASDQPRYPALERARQLWEGN